MFLNNVRKILYLCFCLGLGLFVCQMLNAGYATISGCESFSSFFIGLDFGEHRTGFSYSDEDLMIFYLGFKCGFWYDHL